MELGEVEFTPTGSEETETRPRLLVFSTNISDPNSRSLQTQLDLRIAAVGDEGRTFQIVERDLDELCDVSAGEICARFGLDDTSDGELNSDKVVHQGRSGTITFTQLTATTLAAEWSIEFGPNINRAFDESSGSIEGCFTAVVGDGTSDANELVGP